MQKNNKNNFYDVFTGDLKSDTKKLNTFLSKHTSLNEYVKQRMSEHFGLMAITDTYNNLELTYDELEQQMANFASGLQALGVRKDNFIDVFTENNGRWCVCHYGILRCGAVSVLRGASAPLTELDYIVKHSDASGVILRDGMLLKSLKPYLNNHKLNFIILMFRNEKDDISDLNIPVYYFDDVIEIGKKFEFIPPVQTLNDNCVMLYTSGTTGNPKGVLLTHKNIISQFPLVDAGFQSKPGENTLQILPVWHAYEHTAQTYYLLCGCHLHFTTISGLKNDLTRYKIATFMSVPRIWEALRIGLFQQLKQKSVFVYHIFKNAIKISITYTNHLMYIEHRITNKNTPYTWMATLYHNIMCAILYPAHKWFYNTLYKKIKTIAGINFRASITGGGALSMNNQLFYEAMGVNLREGYGLTETSPVLVLRGVNIPNFLGSCGKPIPTTEIKIINPETYQESKCFEQGLIKVRGYQVMKGYYKDKTSTDLVIDKDGWFNTGDLGWLTNDNNLVITGRLKETICLSSGENVEPVPIENACLESQFIDQIMLVGQDRTFIGALIVPSLTALHKAGLSDIELQKDKNLEITDKTLINLIQKEINIFIKHKTNLKPYEQIKRFTILKNSFKIDNGLLSQTGKMKRNNITQKYIDIINKMFEKR